MVTVRDTCMHMYTYPWIKLYNAWGISSCTLRLAWMYSKMSATPHRWICTHTCTYRWLTLKVSVHSTTFIKLLYGALSLSLPLSHPPVSHCKGTRVREQASFNAECHQRCQRARQWQHDSECPPTPSPIWSSIMSGYMCSLIMWLSIHVLSIYNVEQHMYYMYVYNNVYIHDCLYKCMFICATALDCLCASVSVILNLYIHLYLVDWLCNVGCSFSVHRL